MTNINDVKVTFKVIGFEVRQQTSGVAIEVKTQWNCLDGTIVTTELVNSLDKLVNAVSKLEKMKRYGFTMTPEDYKLNILSE